MKNFFKALLANQQLKKALGIFLIVFGFIGLITPFTPWGILFFVGLELAGVRVLWIEKLKRKLLTLKEKYKKTS
jgi:hypothetical protein